MTWVSYQLERIRIEDEIIQKFFPSFRLSRTSEEAYWEGSMFTNHGNMYWIRIILPQNYPEDVPRAYIVYPQNLYTYRGVLLKSLGTSHAMHTFSSDTQYVQLCLFRSERWSADYTVYKCLKKARIWIEAYDQHLRTGELMCDILLSQK